MLARYMLWYRVSVCSSVVRVLSKRCIEWWHFQWPWVTLTTPLLRFVSSLTYLERLNLEFPNLYTERLYQVFAFGRQTTLRSAWFRSSGPFGPHDAMLARYMLSSCPFVCLSVTSRSPTKMAKPRITQTTPYDSPEILVSSFSKISAKFQRDHPLPPDVFF